MSAVLLAQLEAAGARGRAAVIARLQRDLPELTVSDESAGVRITALGLHARAFGTRGKARDPRLAGILEGLR